MTVTTNKKNKVKRMTVEQAIHLQAMFAQLQKNLTREDAQRLIESGRAMRLLARGVVPKDELSSGSNLLLRFVYERIRGARYTDQEWAAATAGDRIVYDDSISVASMMPYLKLLGYYYSEWEEDRWSKEGVLEEWNPAPELLQLDQSQHDKGRGLKGVKVAILRHDAAKTVGENEETFDRAGIRADIFLGMALLIAHHNLLAEGRETVHCPMLMLSKSTVKQDYPDERFREVFPYISIDNRGESNISRFNFTIGRHWCSSANFCENHSRGVQDAPSHNYSIRIVE